MNYWSYVIANLIIVLGYAIVYNKGFRSKELWKLSVAGYSFAVACSFLGFWYFLFCAGSVVLAVTSWGYLRFFRTDLYRQYKEKSKLVEDALDAI